MEIEMNTEFKLKGLCYKTEERLAKCTCFYTFLQKKANEVVIGMIMVLDEPLRSEYHIFIHLFFKY